jgi:hypothetical protein
VIVWLIFIVPQSGVRYIDTIWASNETANRRLRDLQHNWGTAGNNLDSGHKAYIREVRIEDAVIKEDPDGTNGTDQRTA